MQKTLKRVVLFFTLWRLLLLGVALVADQVLKYSPSFPYAATLLAPSGLPRFLYSFANFDGVHYITIAEQGYRTVQYIQAFFPLLPLLIKPFFALPAPWNLGLALIFTNLVGLGALILWYFFVRAFFNERTAMLSFLVLLLFPTSLFFGALYTEGLFLSLILIAFWAGAKGHWKLATVATFLASATRIVGIFLVPALILELHLQPRGKTFPWSKAALICLGSLGLLLYMGYLKLALGDPLAFFHAQAAFGAGRQTALVIYPQVVFRAFKILITVPIGLKYIAYLQEFCAGTLGLLGVLLGAKYARPSWTLFALCAFFLPPLTGTFSSMGRYLLVCFPLFIFLGKLLETRPRLKWIWFASSGALLILNTFLFVQGYWVA